MIPPPVALDVVFASLSYVIKAGPYTYGGKYFGVVVKTELTRGDKLAVYRSATPDVSPTTWIVTESDYAIFQLLDVFNVPGDPILHIVYLLSNSNRDILNQVNYIKFDMSTSTFGAPIVTPISYSNPENATDFVILKRPSGDIVICWDDLIGGFQVCFAIVYNGVSWSSTIPLAASLSTVNIYLDSGAVNGAGICGIFLTQRDVALRIQNVFLVTISGTVAAAPVNTGSVDTFANIWARLGPSLYDPKSDSFVQPVTTKDHVTDDFSVKLLVGTPSAAPVFSSIVVSAAGDVPVYALPVVIITSAGFTCVWLQELSPPDSFEAYVLQSNATAITGPWDGPSTAFNLHTNPPTDSVWRFGDGITTLNAQFFFSTKAGALIGLFAHLPNGGDVCGVPYFIDLIVPAGPLALACPVNSIAVVGVPYNGQLVVSGGVAPYAFSIVSGALPPGLVLNPATGAITGTPTQSGVFNFIAKVTDSNAATALTPGCPLTVLPGCNSCPLTQVVTPVMNVGTQCNPIM